MGIWVVICSKFPTFVVESTTESISSTDMFCCDLLEISYLCGRINNRLLTRSTQLCVVICSKFPTFVVESTTTKYLLYLCTCCDLLEISYLCGRINNLQDEQKKVSVVVICSKFPTFVVESTTRYEDTFILTKL